MATPLCSPIYMYTYIYRYLININKIKFDYIDNSSLIDLLSVTLTTSALITGRRSVEILR